MNMTDGQRKFFLWCGGILAAWWVFGLVSGWVHKASVRQQARHVDTSPLPMPYIPPSPAPAAKPPAAAATSGDLSGVWIGKAAVEGRGICGLRLELQQKEPDGYTGYSSFGCVNAAPLMSEQNRTNRKAALLNRMDPDTAILTGTKQDEDITFHVDKTMGTDINGCTLTAFSLTPFGATQLVAEWQSGECGGGHMMLVKARK